MSAPVITGAGVVSGFGVGARALFAGLAEGRSAVGPIRSFDASTFPTRVAAEVPVLVTDAAWLNGELSRIGELNRKAGRTGRTEERWAREGRLRDRKVAFGVLAAAEAWRSAGCGEAEEAACLSIALGLEHGFLADFAAISRDGEVDWAAEPGAPLPRVRLRSTVELAAACIEELLDLRGPTVIHASACAAGGLAVAHAAALIARGEAEVVLAGGADSMVNPLGIGGMSRIGAPSPRAEPDACRPFDRRRDGLVIGEGAAMFVIESEARALARGARPLARILGWGSTQDAYRLTAPRPDGSAARRAMERALRRAGLAPEAVDYINAHGTGTPLNDPAEVLAIRGALGPRAERVPVSSIKGAVGHLMAASGAIELAACLLPLRGGVLPGTAHHRERDPECDLDIIGERPRAGSAGVVLSNSFGFGGQNVSVLLGRSP
jgi:3-oxoacyl-(acyl-carrier-protein) synthase